MRINGEIRAKSIRVIDSDGSQLDIMPLKEALKIAEDKGLDLVEISPKAVPPVCKIMDFGKYRFEQAKKEKEAKKKQTVINVKEVKFRIKIEEHDFQVKAKHAEKFLNSGNKVKVSIMFRGREQSHAHLGEDICNRLAEQLKDIAIVEHKPKTEGRNMIMVLAPKSEKERKAAAKAIDIKEVEEAMED